MKKIEKMNKKFRQNRKVIILISILILLTTGIYGGYRYIISNPPYQFLIDIFSKLSCHSLNSARMDIEFLPEAEKLKISANMKIVPDDNSRKFFVFALSDGLQIESASVNGKKVNVYSLWVANIIHLPSNTGDEKFTLELDYSGVPTGFSKKHADEKLRKDFAYIDNNSLYYPFTAGKLDQIGVDKSLELNLISPVGINAVTGGSLTEKKQINNKVHSKWKNKKFTQVVFGKLQRYIESKPKKINIFMPSEYESKEPPIAENIVELCKTYENILGKVEPDFLNLVVLPGYDNGRFSNGMITIGKNRLKFLDDGSLDEEFYSILAHEIGHFYWNSSSDLTGSSGQQWYVEGFTEYASEWMTGQKYGMSVYVDNLNRKINYLREKKHKALLDYTYWEYSNIPYYKGTLMLESLRRLEGAEAVFTFLNKVRNTPEKLKDIDTVVEVAQQVFGKDYSYFFKHWLKGVEPVNLKIEDVVWGEDEISFNIISNQDLKFSLDIMLSGIDNVEPGKEAKNAVSLPEGERLVKRKIKSGENKVKIKTDRIVTGIYLDPYRKFYRLEDMFNYPQVTRPLPTVKENDISRLYRKLDYLENPSLKQIESMTDNWLEVNKEINIADKKWKVEKIFEDYNAYWAILSPRFDSVYPYVDLELEVGYNNHHSRIIHTSFENDRILVKWDKWNDNNEAYTGGKIIKIHETGKDKGLEIKMPLQKIIKDNLYFIGEKVSFSEFTAGIERLTFYDLEAELELGIKAKNDYIPKLNDIDFQPVGGNFKSSNHYSWSTKGNRLEYRLKIPFLNKPYPLAIKINGIEYRKEMNVISEYIPGGILWIGLEDKISEWENRHPARIKLDSGQNIYIAHDLNYYLDGRSIGCSIAKGKSGNQLYLTVEAKEADVVKPYLSQVDRTIGLNKEFYKLPQTKVELSQETKNISSGKTNLFQGDSGEEDNDEGDSGKKNRKTVKIPIDPENIKDGWYNIGVDIENKGRSIGGFESSSAIYIYQPESLVKQEKIVRNKLEEVLQNIENGEKNKVEEYFNENKPYWYNMLLRYVGKNGGLKVKFKDVKIEYAYNGEIVFSYEIQVFSGDKQNKYYIGVLVDKNGKLKFR